MHLVAYYCGARSITICTSLLVLENKSKHELTLAFLLILCLVVMEIQSFRVIVNLEFLLVLSDVFTSAVASDESLTPQQPSKAIATKDKPESAAIVNTTDEEQITVQISIKDPEIVLLADARDKDTNALFLKVNFTQQLVSKVLDSIWFENNKRKYKYIRVLSMLKQ